MRLLVYSIAASACICASPALAQDTGVYLEIDGGITAANDSDFDSQADADINGTIEWGTGLDAGAIVGYDFGAFRIEGEVAYKKHGFDRVTSGGTTVEESDDLSLDFTTWSGMVNALADFGPPQGINGFVGGGIGLASTSLDLRDTRDTNNDSDEDSDSGFAWQLLAGVRAPVSPSVDVGLKYRYFSHSGISFIVSDEDDFNTDFSSHSVLLTVTFKTGG